MVAASQPSASISRGISVGGPQTVTLAPIRVKARMSERATRECRTSPTIQMLSAVERAEPAPQREHVEQRLGRVLVLAVAGVDHRRGGPAGDQLRGAGVGRADHDRRRVVGRQRLDGVLERLALVDARAGERMLTTSALRRLAASSKLELVRVLGLVEEVDDRAAAERRDLLDLAARDLGEGLGPVEDALDRGAVEIVDRDQVASRCRSCCRSAWLRRRGRSSPRRRRRSPRRGR